MPSPAIRTNRGISIITARASKTENNKTDIVDAEIKSVALIIYTQLLQVLMLI
jgi:hypothetical protein